MPNEIEGGNFDPKEEVKANTREQEIAEFKKVLLEKSDVIHEILYSRGFRAKGVNPEVFNRWTAKQRQELDIDEINSDGEIWFNPSGSTETSGCYNINTKELIAAMDDAVNPWPADTEELFSPEIEALMPEEDKQFFTDIENKHFNPNTAVGSRFVIQKPKKHPDGKTEYLPPDERLEDLKDLLVKAAIQRGDLQGDDREILLKLGASPESLQPNVRYLLVKTEGKLGIVNIKKLSPDTKVKVVRTKQNVPCSLVVEGDLVDTHFATIIIGPNENEKASTKETIWTAHPGLPIKPASEDIWPEGSEITVKEVMEKLGNNVYLNIEVGESKHLIEQINTAIEKLGRENVFGPEEVFETFGVRLAEVPKIPFSASELETARELGQMLVLRIGEIKDGGPMSIEAMIEILQEKWKREGRKEILNFPDNWKKPAGGRHPASITEIKLFSKQFPRPGWALVSKDFISETEGKDFFGQTESIIHTLQDKVFKNTPLPTEYAEAISEFNEKKDKLLAKGTTFGSRNLKGWQFSELKIIQLTTHTLQEIVYDALIYFDRHKQRLLKDRHYWTASLSPDNMDKLLCVSDSDKEGMHCLLGDLGSRNMGHHKPLGTCLSRRS